MSPYNKKDFERWLQTQPPVPPGFSARTCARIQREEMTRQRFWWFKFPVIVGACSAAVAVALALIPGVTAADRESATDLYYDADYLDYEELFLMDESLQGLASLDEIDAL